MCFKISKSRKQLKKLALFLNKNRIWICSDNCVDGLGFSFCSLIYQINYSFKTNEEATVTTFRNSIFGRSFLLLEDIYDKHKGKKNWQNYYNYFKK